MIKRSPIKRGIVGFLMMLSFLVFVLMAGCTSPGVKRDADLLELKNRVEMLDRRVTITSPASVQEDLQSIRRLKGDLRLLKEGQVSLNSDVKALTEAVERLQGRLASNEAAIRDLSEKVGGVESKSSGDPKTAGEAKPDVSEEAEGDDARQAAAAADLFRRGRENFTAGRFDMAIAEFREFVKTFPESDLADDAQYWMGESFYAAGDLEKAEAEFNRLMTLYGKGDRVPAALLKLSLLLSEKGQIEKAKGKLLLVINRYPHSNEAPLAEERLVQLELKRKK